MCAVTGSVLPDADVFTFARTRDSRRPRRWAGKLLAQVGAHAAAKFAEPDTTTLARSDSVITADRVRGVVSILQAKLCLNTGAPAFSE